MKKGKKYVSYKLIYNSLYFLKKLIGIQPLLILKKSLYQHRFLFDIQYLKLRKRVITIPKWLSIKSQLTKSLKYIFNNSVLNTFKIYKQKKHLSFYKKISYLILNNLFFKSRLKKLIKKESLIVKNNFYHISKETYLGKYLNENNTSLKKVRLFKKKFKSFTKKDKMLKAKQYQFYNLKKKINFKKMFLFNRYQLNLQSKTKLKSKWF